MAERPAKYDHAAAMREHAAHVAKERAAGRWASPSPPTLNKQQVERVETYKRFVIERVKAGVQISGQAMMALTKDQLKELGFDD